MSQLDFDGRVVIITGAGRGLGRAYALLLAERGARVVVADLGASTDGTGSGGDDPAAAVVAEIERAGGQAVAVREDVSTSEGSDAIVQAAIDTFGRLDAVINNAGIIRSASFLEIETAEYQRQLDVHYFGTLFMAKSAWPHLIKSGDGRIVNTVSGALLGVSKLTHYGSSKGAVLALTRSLALEGIDHGIKVNAIAPGAGTRMVEASVDSLPEEVLAYMRTQMRPELVAPLAAYLTHPACSITGETFNAAAGGLSRLAFVNTVGIHDPEMTPETIAERIDEVMAITEQATPQIVAPLHIPTA